MDWPKVVKRFADGFSVNHVGEGGVVGHDVFRNLPAMQTHPKDRKLPCRIQKNLNIPANRTTTLKLKVSHHPHGDWQLRVLADGKVLADQIVSSKTVGDDEWLDVDVDLSPFAGKAIRLVIENRANDWMNEWAYWNKIQLVSE